MPRNSCGARYARKSLTERLQRHKLTRMPRPEQQRGAPRKRRGRSCVPVPGSKGDGRAQIGELGITLSARVPRGEAARVFLWCHRDGRAGHARAAAPRLAQVTGDRRSPFPRQHAAACGSMNIVFPDGSTKEVEVLLHKAESEPSAGS